MAATAVMAMSRKGTDKMVCRDMREHRAVGVKKVIDSQDRNVKQIAAKNITKGHVYGADFQGCYRNHEFG